MGREKRQKESAKLGEARLRKENREGSEKRGKQRRLWSERGSFGRLQSKKRKENKTTTKKEVFG